MNTFKSFLLFNILLLTTPALLFAQNVTDAKGLKQGEWQKKDAEGRLLYEGSFKDNVPQGVFKYYYETGKVRSQLTYAQDGKSATAINFHPNGKKMAEGMYVNTKKDGHWKYFNDLETPSADEYYDKGTSVGVWKTYYDDGKLLEECPYQNGLKHGVIKQYFTDGVIKSEVNFRNGKYEGKSTYYFHSGKPLLIGTLHDDMKEGLWITYKETGEKESEIEYTNGQIVNEKYYDKAKEEELKNDVKEIQE